MADLRVIDRHRPNHEFTWPTIIAWGKPWLLRAAVGLAVASLELSSWGADRLNVLFLFADDMRPDTIAAHGNRYIRTPNLDRLVHSGFSFHANYIFGGNSGAVCVPSRAMLMTGKCWFHVNTASLKGATLLPEWLGQHGYVTFATGKWHNSEPAFLRSFQQGKNIMFGGMADHTKVPVRDLGPDGTLSAERVGERFSSELFADAAIEFLRSHDRHKPFFAYVAFTAPHDPRQAPPGYIEPYYRRRPPVPPNFRPQFFLDPRVLQAERDESLAPWPRTEAVIRDQLAEYYGLITHLDEQIGRILTALKQLGYADNTLVLFTADNGLALGSHGLLGKQNLFEHSMRVPLIMAGPGIPAGRSTRALTYLLDLFPTLCEVLGIEPPPGLEGESLCPLWEGRRKHVRESVFLAYRDSIRAVRDERWKLIAYPQIGHLQLFDLRADPHETRNLVDQRRATPHLARLQDIMAQWQAKVGDTVPLPKTNQPPPPLDLTGRARKPDRWQPDWIVEKYFGGSR